MTDARKVRPVAPLDVQHDGRYWWVDVPTPHNGTAALGMFTDAEFAAAFMPAELFDAVLDAARENAYRDGNGQPCECRTCVAVRAYDAHGQAT